MRHDGYVRCRCGPVAGTRIAVGGVVKARGTAASETVVGRGGVGLVNTQVALVGPSAFLAGHEWPDDAAVAPIPVAVQRLCRCAPQRAQPRLQAAGRRGLWRPSCHTSMHHCCGKFFCHMPVRVIVPLVPPNLLPPFGLLPLHVRRRWLSHGRRRGSGALASCSCTVGRPCPAGTPSRPGCTLTRPCVRAAQ